MHTVIKSRRTLGIGTAEHEYLPCRTSVGQRVMRARGVLAKYAAALSLGGVHDLPSRFPISFRCHPSVAQRYSTMKITHNRLR